MRNNLAKTHIKSSYFMIPYEVTRGKIEIPRKRINEEIEWC